jgi:hypothetical protein
MTKRAFQRLRAGNLIWDEFSKNLWVVVECRRRTNPCLIVERATPLLIRSTASASFPSFTTITTFCSISELSASEIKRVA